MIHKDSQYTVHQQNLTVVLARSVRSVTSLTTCLTTQDAEHAPDFDTNHYYEQYVRLHTSTSITNQVTIIERGPTFPIQPAALPPNQAIPRSLKRRGWSDTSTCESLNSIVHYCTKRKRSPDTPYHQMAGSVHRKAKVQATVTNM